MDIALHPIQRLSRDLIARFAGVPASVAANLCGRPIALHHSIGRICGTGVAIGSALTAHAAPGDNLAAHIALGEAREGDILMIATDACEECAVVGDRVAGMAANGGVVAIVSDGLARDIVGLRAIGLSIHARGLSPASPRRSGPAHVGGRVEMGGIAIESGDLIVADDDGVAVIPRREIEHALARLAEARNEEEHVMAAIRAGARQPDWIAPLLKDIRPPSE